ncbi:MAG: hypothetical protein Q4F34_00975 [Prevotellaceae bacterium]|nr:hypothetical protein [Prevotellaceae bacterium]
MKKILMAIVALVMTTAASAQGFGGQFNPEQMAQLQAKHISEVCKTDTAQTRKITEYLVKTTKEMMEKMQNNQGGGFDMEGFKKQREEQEKFFKETLTEEQFKLYADDQKKMMERFMNHGGGF